MTITRALAELKNINARIEKLTANSLFMSTTGSAFGACSEIDIRANWTSVNDLISRYEKMKFAILQSNSSTIVKIGGREYTVAEAIAMKDCIQYRKNLLDKVKRDRTYVLNTVAQHQNIIQNKLDTLLQTNFKERLTSEADIKNIQEAYMKTNEIKIVDPLKLDSLIPKLESEYDDFMTNVNFTLSESNAITTIAV